jgi:hypothetical protein
MVMSIVVTDKKLRPKKDSRETKIEIRNFGSKAHRSQATIGDGWAFGVGDGADRHIHRWHGWT